MPENFIELPDGKKVVIFDTNQHPDFQGTVVNIPEYLYADIPSYTAVANDTAPALNKNILSVWNANGAKRIRIQSVYVYPFSLAANTITLQLMYINAAPTGGTNIPIQKITADYPNPPPQPNTIVAATGATATPTSPNVILGGCTFSLNTAAASGKYIIFEASRNSSAIQLRPGSQDGLVLRQTSGAGTTGTVTAHLVFTLD